MPKLINLGFEREEHEYELGLDWDDGAFVERQVKIDVTARRRHKNEEQWQEYSVSLSLEDDDEQGPVIRVKSQDYDEKFPLNGLLEESQLIDLLPAHVFAGGEPVTGCLIRSGISATVGQIISCRNETAGIEWFRARARAMFSCLRENIPNMTGRMALRAAVCIARGGF